MIKFNKKVVGVNTHRANRIVEHGLQNKLLKEFVSIKYIKPEFKYSDDTTRSPSFSRSSSSMRIIISPALNLLIISFMSVINY